MDLKERLGKIPGRLEDAVRTEHILGYANGQVMN
jgi:hypothetical protein